jgi:transposase-like protein
MIVSELIKEIQKLNESDRRHLVTRFQSLLSPQTQTKSIVLEANEIKAKDGFHCVYCGFTNVTRNGHSKEGRQRYYCKDCHKSFCDTSATPLFHCRKPDKWLEFIECTLLGMSLRDSSERIGVNYVNLFYWRHKIFAALEDIQAESLEGIVEADETFFLESSKGKKSLERKPRKRGGAAKKRGLSNEQICVLVARDRNKNTIYKIIGRGRPSKAEIENGLSDKITDGSILCSDCLRAYTSYSHTHDLKHYRFKSDGKRTKGIYHIQNVNSYHSRLKSWLAHFKGVATKYLNGYLALFNFLDAISFDNTFNGIRQLAVQSLLHQEFETKNSLRLKIAEI